jgi:hypothetical protein
MTILKKTSSIGQGGCMQCKDEKKVEEAEHRNTLRVAM